MTQQIYIFAEKQLHLITQTGAIFSKLNIIQQESPLVHFSSAQTCQLPPLNRIVTYTVSGKYIFFAQGQYGLAIYEAQENSEPKLIKSLVGNFLDVKVVAKDDQTKIIYCLDKEVGVKTFSLINGVVSDKSISTIKVSNGISMDIYRNSLVVVRNQGSNNYYADDFQISNDSWILLNSWTFDSKISKVHITKEFAVFIGVNGHYTIQHSIFKDFYPRKGISQTSHMSNQIAIHGLIEMDFFAEDLKSQELQELIQHDRKTLFGITKHQLIFVEWEEEPLSIECFSDNQNHIVASPLKLEFFYNTTKCSLKVDQENDLQMCILQKQYEIYFVKSFLTMKHKILLFVIILSLFSFFMIMVVLIIYRFLEFRKEQGKTQVVIRTLTQEGYIVELDSVKEKDQKQSTYIKGIQSYDRTPQNETN